MTGCEELGWRGVLRVCGINQLSIMNTWFQKKKQHYSSWTHPGTRCSSMVDFVVVRSSDCRFCLDAQVMRQHPVGLINAWLRPSYVLGFRRLFLEEQAEKGLLLYTI